MENIYENGNKPVLFDPRSAAFRTNPYPTFKYLREKHPIHYRKDCGDWLLTRYKDVSNLMRNPALGRAEKVIHEQNVESDKSEHPFLAARKKNQELMSLWFLLRNPPDQKRIRLIVRRGFTTTQISKLRGYINEQTDKLLDSVIEKGKMDFVKDFAFPLMIGVNCKTLGISEEKLHPKLRRWSDEVSLITDLDVLPINYERGLMAIAGLGEYFREQIDKSSLATKAENTTFELLKQGEAEGKLSSDEVISTCILMFTVNSTTTNLLGNIIYTLMKHPKQFDLLRNDMSLVGNAIEEVTRYETPVQGISRTALSDVKIGDYSIQRDEKIIGLIGAANRDHEQFENADKFDIRRSPNKHLSFGQGIHACIGKHLSMMVAQIAISRVLERMPNLALDSSSFEWGDSFFARGLKSLPVSF